MAYKVLAAMLKNRLLNAGVDTQLWESQFGFRKDRSTPDAIFVARRRIETACAQRHGRISLLALDWSKAFDSINAEALLKALLRFGLPEHFVDTIEALLRSCLLYTSPSPRDATLSRMPSSA